MSLEKFSMRGLYIHSAPSLAPLQQQAFRIASCRHQPLAVLAERDHYVVPGFLQQHAAG
jgi:hypothetical protein